MAGLAVTVSLKGARGVLSRVRKRVSKPLVGRVRKPIAQAMRDSALRDFDRGGHHAPSGGFRPWVKTHPFGDCEPAAKILGGPRGSIGTAWRNASAIPSARSVTIVARHPGMRAHRFGATVKAKKRSASGRLAMIGALALKCGVHLSEEKALSGLVIPARPFADKNPRLAREIEKIVVEALVA